MRPQATQRRGAITLIRRAVRLEAVDADFLRGVHVPTRLGEERRDVTGRAPRLVVEQRRATHRGLAIEAPARRLRRFERKLVEVQCAECGRDQVALRGDVTEART